MIVGGWALWMFWRQRADWKHGVALSILSIVWLVAALKWAIPSAAGGQQSHFLQDRYGHLGATYSEVAWKLFTEPHLVLDMLMGRPVRSWFGHLGPAAWVEPVAIVAALPNILLNRATHYGPQQVLAFYYALPATLSLLLTIPPTIARLGRRFGRTTAVTLALLSNFPATEDVVPPPLQWPQRDDFAAHSALARLDVSSDVVAQTTALPHLSVSSTLRLFEGPVTGEWLVLTPRKLAWPMSRKSVVEALRQAIRSGQYGAIFVNTSVVILRRGAPGPLDVQALEEADAAQALE